MKKQNKTKTMLIWIGGFLLFFLIGLFIRPYIMISSLPAPVYNGNVIDYVGQLLSITDERFDEEALAVCNMIADECYDRCDTDLELSVVEYTYDFFNVVPVASAIVDDTGELDCYGICDANYTMCEDDARIETIEDYIWDGVEPTNINSFFETNYPIFYDNSKLSCEGFFWEGTWVETANKVGCTDIWAWWITCESTSLASASNVCTTVGGTFTCADSEISCNI